MNEIVEGKKIGSELLPKFFLRTMANITNALPVFRSVSI